MFIHTFFLYMGGVERVKEVQLITEQKQVCIMHYYKSILHTFQQQG